MPPPDWVVKNRSTRTAASGQRGAGIVHPDPEKAQSDGYQQLNFQQFEETMELCRRVADAVGKKIEAEEECLAAQA